MKKVFDYIFNINEKKSGSEDKLTKKTIFERSMDISKINSIISPSLLLENFETTAKLAFIAVPLIYELFKHMKDKTNIEDTLPKIDEKKEDTEKEKTKFDNVVNEIDNNMNSSQQGMSTIEDYYTGAAENFSKSIDKSLSGSVKSSINKLDSAKSEFEKSIKKSKHELNNMDVNVNTNYSGNDSEYFTGLNNKFSRIDLSGPGKTYSDAVTSAIDTEATEVSTKTKKTYEELNEKISEVIQKMAIVHNIDIVDNKAETKHGHGSGGLYTYEGLTVDTSQLPIQNNDIDVDIDYQSLYNDMTYDVEFIKNTLEIDQEALDRYKKVPVQINSET